MSRARVSPPQPAQVVAVTPYGRAVFEVEPGRVASLCGLELDSDLLSGGGARLVTCPAELAKSDARGWVCAAPEWKPT